MVKILSVATNLENKKILFLLILIYSFLVSWGFTIYLAPSWGYFGLEAEEPTFSIKFLSLFFCILPFFFIPKVLSRPSIFAVWILYFFVYIPMVVGVFFDKKIEFNDKGLISFSYLLGMIMLCSLYKLNLLRFRPNRISTKYFWSILYSITLLMLLYIVIIFRDNLQFGNIFSSDKIYDIRSSGKDIQDKAFLAGYIILWLSNALLPFILCVGFVEKNKIKVIVGVLGLVILYMTMANKQFLFSILYLYLIFKLFNSSDLKKITKFLLYITVPTAFLLVFSHFVNLPFINETIFILSSIFLLRTVYTSTMMSVYYNVFFEHHPYLYFSQINGINKFVDYPFEQPLGVEVGQYFVPSVENFNANANFFLTDGLSSIGLYGIPLVGFFAAVVFYFYDSSASKNNKTLSILLISNSCIALMNVSLFTTLISGGLLLYMFLLNNNNLFQKN